jgi:ArsR family transcriptional regulator
LFHALSEPVRLEVLELLVDGEHCVCEITDALDIAQSRLSFHLKVLKDARLITDRRAGRWTYYAIVRETFDEAVETLTALRPRAARSRSSPACCD